MKKFFIPLLVAMVALASLAFTTHKKAGAKKDPPTTGYFSFTGTSGEQKDASKYIYIGQTAPGSDCTLNTIVCTVLAELAAHNSEDPGDWTPDFSSFNPVDNLGHYSYLTRRAE